MSIPIVSIVIPSRSDDISYSELLYDLEHLSVEFEVLIVLPFGTPEPTFLKETLPQRLRSASVRAVFCEAGRAKQLNTGALKATSSVLWFIHGDSRIDRETLRKVAERILSGLDGNVWYLGLSFMNDGPRQVRLNSICANLRARCGLPFGDQSFLLQTKTFQRLEAFPTSVTWGEDHAFVWRCHACGIKLKKLPGVIQTSARAYTQHGWSRTTLKYVAATVLQAMRFRREALAWAQKKTGC